MAQTNSAFDHATALMRIIQQLVHLQSWIGGCDCHDNADALPAGQGLPRLRKHRKKRPMCPFKGCRARTLSGQVAATLEAMDADRRGIVPDQFGSVCSLSVMTALTEAISLVTIKFHWVNEIPYLIWQVPPGVMR